MLLVILVVAGIAASLLPASLLARLLPSEVHAEDFSGSIWHGSAGHITVNSRDAGALEWHLHLLPLMSLSVVADLHWVKVSSVVDGVVELSRNGLIARDVKGGGSLDDLRELGLSPGWRGAVSLALSELKTDYHSITAANGTLSVSGISSPQLANGANLGNYQVRLGPESLSPDGTLKFDVNDSGGPVELAAKILLPPGAHTGTLSGFIRERPEAAPALRDQIASLAQIRPRDTAGRIPVELEFTL